MCILHSISSIKNSENKFKSAKNNVSENDSPKNCTRSALEIKFAYRLIAENENW